MRPHLMSYPKTFRGCFFAQNSHHSLIQTIFIDWCSHKGILAMVRHRVICKE